MTKKVLIVEDSRAQARSIEQMFRQLGFCTDSVASRGEAIEKLATTAFDLLLLDVFLGEENSLDHLYEYKALKPDLGIAVMTAGNFSESDSIAEAINRARRAHVDYILAKPFKLIDVADICRELESKEFDSRIRIESDTVFLP